MIRAENKSKDGSERQGKLREIFRTSSAFAIFEEEEK